MLGALIGAAGSLIGGMISGNKTKNAQESANQTNLQINRETNAANKELAQQQNQWNIDQWNRENAYNSPTAQKERLEAAGLNSSMAFGQGQISSGTASSMQSANLANQQATQVQAADGFGSLFQNGMNGFAQQLSQIMPNLIAKQQADANTKNSDTNRMVAESQVSKNAAETANVNEQTRKIQAEIPVLDARVHEINANVQKTLSEISLNKYQDWVNQNFGKQQVEAQLNQMLTASMANLGSYQINMVSAELAPLYAKVAKQNASANWYNAQTSRMHLAIDKQNADANSQNAATNSYNAETGRMQANSNIKAQAIRNQTELNYTRKEISARIQRMKTENKLTSQQADLLEKQNNVFYLKFVGDMGEQWSRTCVNGTGAFKNAVQSLNPLSGLSGSAEAAPSMPSSLWQN